MRIVILQIVHNLQASTRNRPYLYHCISQLFKSPLTCTVPREPAQFGYLPELPKVGQVCQPSLG